MNGKVFDGFLVIGLNSGRFMIGGKEKGKNEYASFSNVLTVYGDGGMEPLVAMERLKNLRQGQSANATIKYSPSAEEFIQKLYEAVDFYSVSGTKNETSKETEKV